MWYDLYELWYELWYEIWFDILYEGVSDVV